MIILCADDYGISDGVSRGILELSLARCLSATSAMVTFERWSADGQRLRQVRDQVAVGLHLNLTLGRPLVAMAGAGHLDKEGGLLPVGTLIRHATGFGQRLSIEALRSECRAQIEAFHGAVGALPDFIDGHQHVHVVNTIRHALLAAMADFSWKHPPLVRVPSSTGLWSRARCSEWRKRGAVAGLSIGMRNLLEQAGLPANDTFAGFSSLAAGSDYGRELTVALGVGGSCHIVMCHPGYGDEELTAQGDPVIERRTEELAGILGLAGLPERIWHPERETDGSIDWVKAMSQ